jgi:hypothetical protein
MSRREEKKAVEAAGFLNRLGVQEINKRQLQLYKKSDNKKQCNNFKHL